MQWILLWLLIWMLDRFSHHVLSVWLNAVLDPSNVFCFIFYVDGFMAIYSIYSLLVLDSGFQQVRFIFHGLHCHGFCKFPFPMLGNIIFWCYHSWWVCLCCLAFVCLNQIVCNGFNYKRKLNFEMGVKNMSWKTYWRVQLQQNRMKWEELYIWNSEGHWKQK